VTKKVATKKVKVREAVGARPVLQFRVHEDLYEQLKKSAAQHRLSISEEAASRLAGTLKWGGLAPHVPHSPNIERLATLVASAFWHAGQRASGFEDYTSSKWMNDQKCYQAGLLAAVQSLIGGMPSLTRENRELALDGIRRTLIPEGDA
jgi:hypothetical protein